MRSIQLLDRVLRDHRHAAGGARYGAAGPISRGYGRYRIGGRRRGGDEFRIGVHGSCSIGAAMEAGG